MSTTVGRSLGAFRLPIIVIALLASLLLIVPFLVLVSTSWTAGSFILFPPEGFSLQWYAEVLGDRRWMGSFWLSIWESLIATVIATVLGVAGAIGLTRVRSRQAQRWVRTLFIVPIALPPIAYAVGLYGVNMDFGFLRGTLVTLVVGHALIAMPYVFVIVSGGIARIDPALRPAAWTLGARWPLILWKIELPALLPYVLSGALFAFIVVFDEVVLAVFLLPPGVQTLPLKMLSAASEAFSPELTAASTLVSVLAIVLLAFVPLITSRLSRRNRPSRRRTPAVPAVAEGVPE
ncbi:putative spermidine/putrescine transport system permease protein [Microbacterium sp. AG1240]|uniref:ABC transporter permease n=1 Tax=Microbacterium sp. AG1240 TaxID=2183992 RepID=UPI000EAE750B|nr:ABC transporter permease [Microbacterium sp. AG1240]RKT35818.1 putative spermidine/putrescine transport system permease protein [Microbacterium sp. AG1240]